MNTNEVERRLEALAAQSEDPAVPKTLYDRLALVDAGGPTAAISQRPGHEHTRSNASRAKGITALGLAATLMLAGSLLYIAGNRSPETTPNPSERPTASAPAPTTSSAASIGTWLNPGNPLTLGTWVQVHKFGGEVDQYRSVSLSWQDGQIVGLADGHNDSWRRNTCVLISRDGHDWACNPLPQPAWCNSRDHCVIPGAIAVAKGHWIAVAQEDPWALPDYNGSVPTITWTSDNGVNWHEQVGAVFTLASNDPTKVDRQHEIRILPTATGFLMAGYELPTSTGAGHVAMWTTTDGTSWQPVTVPGWTVRGAIEISGDPSTGFLAVGACPAPGTTDADPSAPICAAHSIDGSTWTTVDLLAGASPQLTQGKIALATSLGASRYAGLWVLPAVYVPSAKIDPIEYYQLTSGDGVSWRLLHIPMRPSFEVYGLPGTSGACSPGPDGWVGLGGDPGGDSGTYWSPNGFVSERLGPAPDGLESTPDDDALAVVRTPTGIVAIIAIYPEDYSENPAERPTITVWSARIT
jgi:hypothetical protein